MKFWLKATLLVLSMTSFVVSADEVANYVLVKSKIESLVGFKVSSIADSPVPGLLQIGTDKGVFYTSSDGKYLVHGRIFNIEAGMRNETEIALTEMRLEGIADFSDSFIEFKAENEKYVINVFTDITCGYCRKLHNEMADYNNNGITVRYLAFPRGGLVSQSYKDMVSVWCSADKQQAMTKAKGGGQVEDTSCEKKVAQQYKFGQAIGVSGTPNIILPDGSMVPGYQPAKELLNALNNI